MATAERSIVIQAPAEKICAFIGEPANLPDIWPSMAEVKDVEPLPNGGHRFRWVYKMAGARFEGASEDVEYVQAQRVVSKTSGGIDSTITWTFVPEAGGTRVTFHAEYTVPIPLLGKLAEVVIARQNEQEGEVILANLKARMEA